MAAAGSLHHVLVVGAGSIGERHVRCFLATERGRVSFVEINSTCRTAVAERNPSATAYESLDAGLASNPTAVVIATPAPLHVAQATRAVEHGAHVLIEKPLGVTFVGVESLVEAAESRGVIAAVAYVMRANPVLAEMREAIIRGTFGRPLQIVAVAGQDFAFYRPAYRNTYYASRASGGGAVQDALTHVVNAGEWLVGGINRVVADIAHLSIPGVEVEDAAHVLARHGDVLGSYSLNQFQSPNETTITVACERGTVRFEAHESRWRSMTKTGDAWTDHPHPALDRDGPFIRQAIAFLDAVEGKSPPLCSLAEGAATLRVNMAILKSAAGDAWINV